MYKLKMLPCMMNIPFCEILDEELINQINLYYRNELKKNNINLKDTQSNLVKHFINQINFLSKEINRLQNGNEFEISKKMMEYFNSKFPQYSYIQGKINHTNIERIYNSNDGTISITNKFVNDLNQYVNPEIYYMNEDGTAIFIKDLSQEELKEVIKNKNISFFKTNGQNKVTNILKNDIIKYIKSFKSMMFNSFGGAINDTIDMILNIDLSNTFNVKEEKTYKDLNKALFDNIILMFWSLDKNSIKKVLNNNNIFPAITETTDVGYNIQGNNLANCYYGLVKMIWQDLINFYNDEYTISVQKILNFNVNNLDFLINSMKYSYMCYKNITTKINAEYDLNINMYDFYELTDDIVYNYDFMTYILSTDSYFNTDKYKNKLYDLSIEKKQDIEPNNYYTYTSSSMSIDIHDMYNGYLKNWSVEFVMPKELDLNIEQLYVNAKIPSYIVPSSNNGKYTNDINNIYSDLEADFKYHKANDIANLLIYYNNISTTFPEEFLNLYRKDIEKIQNKLYNKLEKTLV